MKIYTQLWIEKGQSEKRKHKTGIADQVTSACSYFFSIVCPSVTEIMSENTCSGNMRETKSDWQELNLFAFSQFKMAQHKLEVRPFSFQWNKERLEKALKLVCSFLNVGRLITLSFNSDWSIYIWKWRKLES